MTQKIPFHFSDHLIALDKIAKDVGLDDQAALKFYQNGARNYLFKCEALCRIFRAGVDKETFDDYYEYFKIPEDKLGDYDNHDALYKEITSFKEVPEQLSQYFLNNKIAKYKELQELLIKDKWISEKTNLYNELNLKLEAIKYPSEEELKNSVGKYIIKQLEKITKAYNDGKLNPENIEDGIHELRRKLRWISIYGQVCDGWIQLKSSKTNDKELAIYLKDDIVKSPFNKLPASKENIKPLNIEANHFYALSWIIAELGKLKDEGLKIIAINTALKNIKKLSPQQITSIQNHFNVSKNQLELIPQKARIITDDFFNKYTIPKRIITDIHNSL